MKSLRNVLATIAVLVFLAIAGFILIQSRPTSSFEAATSTPVAASTSPVVIKTATTYTLADVAKHAGASSCWSTINGKVYDLTSWIDEHPGGPEDILSICGSDGSAAFNAQHGGERQPAAMLATFYIGDLAN